MAALQVAAFGVLITVVLLERGTRVSEAGASLGPQGRHPVARPTPPYEAGALLVKFRRDHRPPAAALVQRGAAFAPFTGSSHLDELHQRYQVRDMQPLLRTVNAGGTRGADLRADEWDAETAAIRQRFATRARRASANALIPDLSGIYKVVVPASTDIPQFAAEYAADPSVEYAEPNYAYSLSFTPDDPFFSSSGLWGQTFPDLWGLHNIHADEAWDLSTGVGAVVAVLDTGLDTHPDILANVWANPGEIAGNGIDDDGDGFVDDVYGWHFLATGGRPSTGDLYDDIGHGSHVAGTIAAVGNNGIGVVGVAWGAQVMQLGIFNGLGATYSDFIAQALAYAVAHGADVANMSFGGPGESFVVRDAVDFAAANGAVMVAAAGNDGSAVSGTYPASYDPVIAVSAVDHLDQPAFFSNFGGKIELAAPGGGDSGPRAMYEPFESVLSLTNGGACPVSVVVCAVDPRLLFLIGNPSIPLLRLAGTSMAAPHVSGVAALIISRHPEFTAEQVRQALRNGADDLGPPGRDARYGYGRLNAARSVAMDAVPVARLQAPKPLSRFHGERITVTGTVQNPNGPTPSWRLLLAPPGQALGEIANGTGEVDAGTLGTVDTGSLARGNALLRLEVSVPGGATASDTLTFTRLATRPYLRQLSDLAPFALLDLVTDAWSDDTGTLVWSEVPRLTFQRIVALNMATAGHSVIGEFRYGNEGFNGPLQLGMVQAAISGDGTTIAFSAPQDLSTSNPNTSNRNFQLFLFDTATATLTQVSQVAGGTSVDFRGLTISADGDRVAFVATPNLDPTVGNADGNPELFYWERPSGVFHQVTNTTDQFGPLIGSTPDLVMSADGGHLAFVSSDDLDPSVGNTQHVSQLFVYDVANTRLHQLTNIPGAGFISQTQLRPGIALSPDGSQVAVALDTFYTGAPANNSRQIGLIDTLSGALSEVMTAPLPGIASSQFSAAFSGDGGELVFQSDATVDPTFRVPTDATSPAGAIYRDDLQTGTIRKLSVFRSGFALAPDGRLALAGGTLTAFDGIDPEGTNADQSSEVYLLDADMGGGLLRLQRGSITPGRNGRSDTFSLKGKLVQAAGPTLDPSADAVSVTLLGANGQLFRATLPAGTLRSGRRRWSYHQQAAADLTRLVLSTDGRGHYSFNAAGKSPGLFAATTPYVTVELQVGNAVFSNAQTFRSVRRQLKYP